MEGTSKTETLQHENTSGYVWYAGIYARLSVDNHGRKNESIDTQIEIAEEYIRKSDNIMLVGCYTDLGKTGTNFQRDGFDKLMADIRRHKITCVIVKDFSRFGRNYIETGNYIEKIFPFFNVRFISVSDGYDSHRAQGENDALSVHLKNIVNELYARDCAQKVRAIKKSKLKQGCYVGGIPSYGYNARWVDGKKILFPEEGTSDIVRKIYEMYDGGRGICSIISWLYGKKVHRPSEYRQTGHVYCVEGEDLKQWPGQTIRTILTNYVYIGALIQIRAGEKIYRSGQKRDIEPDEVIMIEHAHEPIVGEEIFYRIACKIEEKHKMELQKKGLPKDILPKDNYQGLIYCGECGKKLKRIRTSNAKSYKVSVRTYSYGCPDIQRADSHKCGSNFISLNTVNRIVLETIRKELDLSGIRMKTLVDFNRKQGERREREAEIRRRKIKACIHDIDIKMSSQYMQYRAGKIDKDVFLNIKTNGEREKNDLLKEVARQDSEKERIRKDVDAMDQFIRSLWKGKNSTVLDGQALRCLVKRITVYKGRRVEVVFHFSKELPCSIKKECIADEK